MCFCMSTIGMDTYPSIYPAKKLLLHLHMVEISTGRRFFAEELRRKPAEIGGPFKWHEFSRMHREKWHVETVFVILRT